MAFIKAGVTRWGRFESLPDDLVTLAVAGFGHFSAEPAISGLSGLFTTDKGGSPPLISIGTKSFKPILAMLSSELPVRSDEVIEEIESIIKTSVCFEKTARVSF